MHEQPRKNRKSAFTGKCEVGDKLQTKLEIEELITPQMARRTIFDTHAYNNSNEEENQEERMKISHRSAQKSCRQAVKVTEELPKLCPRHTTELLLADMQFEQQESNREHRNKKSKALVEGAVVAVHDKQ